MDRLHDWTETLAPKSLCLLFAGGNEVAGIFMFWPVLDLTLSGERKGRKLASQSLKIKYHEKRGGRTLATIERAARDAPTDVTYRRQYHSFWHREQRLVAGSPHTVHFGASGNMDSSVSRLYVSASLGLGKKKNERPRVS
jgi:hypothetical protein